MRGSTRINCLFCFAILFFASSCNNKERSVPFPEDREPPQPRTTALHFTNPTNLTWPEPRPVKPVVRKFDLNKLPSVPFDSTGFVPFSKPPEQHPFNWEQLPEADFDYHKLPSQPLRFHISMLETPQIVKTSLHLKGTSGEMVYECGEPFQNTNVSALVEDENGFLWIASSHGLDRYDGKNLLLYVRQSIMQNINCMIEDSLGQFWIGTGNGVYVVNTTAGILKHLTTKDGLVCNNIYNIVFDREGRVWTTGFDNQREGEDKGGVSIIDERSQTIKRFRTAEGLSNFFTVALMRDNLDNIWITTLQGGVSIVDLEHEKIRYLRKRSGLLSDSLSSLLQDTEGRIWIADLSGKLNLIDRNRKTITYYGPAQGLKRNAILQILADDRNNIWLASIIINNTDHAHGVEIINPKQKVIKTLGKENAAMSDNVILSLLQDKRGQMWIGTNSGLNLVHRNGSIIEHSGTENLVSSAEDRQGRIWLGILNAGIEIIDSIARSKTYLKSAQGLSNDSTQNIRLVDGKIYATTNGGLDMFDSNFTTITHIGRQQGFSFNPASFSKDQDGLLWLSNASLNTQGFDIYDPKKQTVQHLGPAEGISDSAVLDIFSDHAGNIWLTRVNGSPGIIDRAHKTIKYLKDQPALDESYNKILLVDSKGNIWVGTGKGVYVVNSRADSITAITTREGLINDNIISLNQYGDRIFASTRGGLTIITSPFTSAENKWMFESFGREDGFNKVVGSLECDMVTSDGRFLFADAGVTSLTNGKRFLPSPQTEITGINIFNRTQHFSNDPWTFLKNDDTLRDTNADTFYVKEELPSNNLFAGQNEIKYDSVTTVSNMPVNLSLPYYQNFLQFHFTQVHGDNQDTTWYRYILEGADKSWSEKTYLPDSKNYYSLPPGSYTFKAASLFNGRWAEPAEFSFVISVPWWRTWWAYCLFGLALFSIVYVAVQYRSRKLKAANLALEEKINQRTAELKQSLQDLKATQTQLVQSEKMASLGELTAGIAHEIQNPLNFVNNFSEINKELIAELKNEIEAGNYSDVKKIADDIEENEEKIIHHGNRADAIVKNMLQHSRITTGQKELTDINALCDEYLRLSYHGMRARDKSFNAKLETNFDGSIKKINIVPADIGRVLLNLYNNAFYAVGQKMSAQSSRLEAKSNNYVPTVTVVTKKVDAQVLISVKDNGFGIPQNIVDKIFQPFFTTKPTGQGTGLGLSLSYDIIKAHGGEITLQTIAGEVLAADLPGEARAESEVAAKTGTEFILKLPA